MSTDQSSESESVSTSKSKSPSLRQKVPVRKISLRRGKESPRENSRTSSPRTDSPRTSSPRTESPRTSSPRADSSRKAKLTNSGKNDEVDEESSSPRVVLKLNGEDTVENTEVGVVEQKTADTPLTREETISKIKQLAAKKVCVHYVRLTNQDKLLAERQEAKKKLNVSKTEADVMKAFFTMSTLGVSATPPPKAPTPTPGASIKKLVRSTHPPLMQKDRKELSQREKVVLEFMTSEQVYVTGLRIMKEAYLIPMREKAEKMKHIDERVVDEIFCNIELLYIINDGLCTAIEQRLENWGNAGAEETLGDIFLEQGPKLKGPYCRFGSDYDKGAKTLAQQLATNNDWKQAWTALDDQVFEVMKLRFNDYYITPVQRVPRYGLLIRDLLKATPTTHVDYKQLCDAGDKIEAIAADINMKIRQSDMAQNFAKVLDRGSEFERLKTDPPTRGQVRVWHKDGEISGIFDLLDPRRTPVSKKKAEIILFNDILVATPYLNKKVHMNECCTPTKIMWLTNTLSEKDRAKMGELADTDFKHCVKIVGPEVQWVIGFKTPADKTQWQNALISQMGVTVRDINDSGVGTRKGVFKFRNNAEYDGEWQKGQPDGMGEYEAADGTTYEGFWNHKHGCGFGTKEGVVTGWRFKGSCEVTEEDPYNLWAPFDAPTDRDWQLIMSNAKKTTVEKGSLLIEQGKKNTKLIKLLDGELAIEKKLKEGEDPVQVAVLSTKGSIFGETSVIKSIGQATASVRANTDVEIQEIDVQLLFSIFMSEPGISMRFFRWIARQLATKLRSMDKAATPPPAVTVQDEESAAAAGDESSGTSEDSTPTRMSQPKPAVTIQHSGEKLSPHSVHPTASAPGRLTSSASEANRVEATRRALGRKPSHQRSPHKEKSGAAPVEEDFNAKFGLDASETLFKHGSCTLKGMLKKIGTIYLFKDHIVFASSVFGMNHTEIMPLALITDLALEEDTQSIKVEIRGKKFQFVAVQDFKSLTVLLMKLWEEARTKLSPGELEKEKERRQLRKKESVRGTTKSGKSKDKDKSGSISITSAAAAAAASATTASSGLVDTEDLDVDMRDSDWASLMEGAVTHDYKTGEFIIRQGQQHQRIYQIASGCCDVVVDTPEGRKHLVRLQTGALIGEMTFLDPDNQKATASVIAGSDDCSIYIIEGHFISMLMVDQPHLAGKFYSYLCSILAKRHSDRELSQKK